MNFIRFIKRLLCTHNYEIIKDKIIEPVPFEAQQLKIRDYKTFRATCTNRYVIIYKCIHCGKIKETEF